MGVGTVRIVHSHEQGTVCEWTCRGDGAGQVLKGLGWRWSRPSQVWFVARSRDRVVDRPVVEQAVQGLVQAGFTVTVEIDETIPDPRAVEQHTAARDEVRAGRLQARADRLTSQANARLATADATAGRWPVGQPVLAGHHSQARMERDLRTVHDNMSAGIALSEQATAVQARADAAAAAAATAARNHPVTAANRIQRLAAQVAADERLTTTCQTHLPQGLAARMATTGAQLAYWQQIRAEQLADGTAPDYGPHNVAVGDQVNIGGRWHTVARCNRKTVAVHTGHSWTDKAPWHTITGHQPAPHTQP